MVTSVVDGAADDVLESDWVDDRTQCRCPGGSYLRCVICAKIVLSDGDVSSLVDPEEAS